jgi:hypothetical protein
MNSETVRIGDKLIYDDGRVGHVDIEATVIGLSPLSVVLAFADRAEPTLVRRDDDAWWKFLSPAHK